MLVLWICVGVQALATLANLPLVFNPLLGRQPSVSGEESGIAIDEDEIQTLLDKGEYVPIKDQYTVNKRRADREEPYLRVRFGKYTKDEIEVLRKKMTTDDLEFVRNAARGRLAVLYQNNKAKEQYLETVHTTRTDIEEISAMKQEMGEWIAEYLYNNGYLIGFESKLLIFSSSLYLSCWEGKPYICLLVVRRSTDFQIFIYKFIPANHRWDRDDN